MYGGFIFSEYGAYLLFAFYFKLGSRPLTAVKRTRFLTNGTSMVEERTQYMTGGTSMVEECTQYMTNGT